MVAARLILRERHLIDKKSFAEIVVWQVPESIRGSPHALKYRLAFVIDGVCVLRYDNEAGKGDHRHAGGTERSYRFTTSAQLLADFWRDVDEWRRT